MTLRLLTADPDARERGLAAASAALRRGQLVGLPVDSTYGVAADAFSERGVAALRAAKGRPDLTVPVLVPRVSTVSGIAQPDAVALRLMRDFWPGGLTVILRAQPTLAWSLTDERGSIAVRQPLHPVALELLDRVGPLGVVAAAAATHDAASLGQDLLGSLAVLLDGGDLPVAPPSTVVDLTGPVPVLLRIGGIDPAALRVVCPDLRLPGP